MEDRVYKTNQRILVMTESYPFFLVGVIKSSHKDMVSVKAEFGVPLPLKDCVFHIRKDSISAFYVENDSCKIPTVW